ncbi:MAG: hypothetical protein M3Z24_03820 [Chloroflexota bacterium]|nr:hypothetical protein [Chloroflexota bacterium]
MSMSSSASSPSLELPKGSFPSNAASQILSECISPYYYYRIEGIRQSESALLVFARLSDNPDTDNCIVLKKLCAYKDTRYSLETLSKRQQCQLEGLRWNRVFTPELYIGLAPLHPMELHQGIICIGEVIETPTKEQLEPDAEYVLLMQKLPENRRLDYLLEKAEINYCQHYTLSLADYVAYMHKYLVFPVPIEDAIRWGSYEQLQRKLTHNLELLDLLLKKVNDNEYQCDSCNKLTDRLTNVRDTFKQVSMQSQYRRYSEQRVAEQRIKYCHGDLKSPHIWIMPYEHDDREPGQPIKLLDAIDFNPLYNHIDILSDFAMLVADVQARTQSLSLVNEMVDRYLQQTDQENECARKVLDYYIIEKAIVGTAISILYDNVPQLGLRFLDVAELRLKSLYSVAV